MPLTHAVLLFSVSYIQPRLCPTASWNPNGTTFASSSTIGNKSVGIFVDFKSSIHVAEQGYNQVQVWSPGSVTPTKTISSSLSLPVTVFATINGDIYIDNGLNGRVDKWSMNANNSVPVMYFTGGWCSGLFVDIDNQLYCSIQDQHQVIRSSRTGDANISTIVAGTGLNGSTSDRLHAPHGIFVDIRFNLYVADCGNDRVQLFAAGQRNATTVAGNETRNPISLSCPTGVVLDGDGYLFIVDSGNNRIVGSGPNGFRCVVGCSRSCSSASDHLCKPVSVAFDGYGKMYVADEMNGRIQIFTQSTKSCCKYNTVQYKPEHNFIPTTVVAFD
jgi:hypothetical protein